MKKTFKEALTEIIDRILINDRDYQYWIYQIEEMKVIHTTRYYDPCHHEYVMENGFYIWLPPEEGDILLYFIQNYEIWMPIFDDIDVVHCIYGYVNSFHGYDLLPEYILKMIEDNEWVEEGQWVYYRVIDSAS